MDLFNTACPVEARSDSSECSSKVENKCGKRKIAHKSSDKDVGVPYPPLMRASQYRDC